jgi:hypothetical protein
VDLKSGAILDEPNFRNLFIKNLRGCGWFQLICEGFLGYLGYGRLGWSFLAMLR